MWLVLRFGVCTDLSFEYSCTASHKHSHARLLGSVPVGSFPFLILTDSQFVLSLLLLILSMISHYTIEFMRQLLMLHLKPADLLATNLLPEIRKEVFDYGCFSTSFLITSGGKFSLFDEFGSNLPWRSREASISKGIQLQQCAAWNIRSLDWRVLSHWNLWQWWTNKDYMTLSHENNYW